MAGNPGYHALGRQHVLLSFLSGVCDLGSIRRGCQEAVVEYIFVLGSCRNGRDTTFLKVSICGVCESLNTTAASLHVVMPRTMATSSSVSGFLATIVAQTSSLPSVFVTLIAYTLLPGYFAASAYLVSESWEYFLFNHRILACLLSLWYVACMLRGTQAIQMKSRRNAGNRAFVSEAAIRFLLYASLRSTTAMPV